MKIGVQHLHERSFLKPVAASTAYLLISHGSRDPRPQKAMNRLAELVRQNLSESFWSEHPTSGEPIEFDAEHNKHAFLNHSRSKETAIEEKDTRETDPRETASKPRSSTLPQVTSGRAFSTVTQSQETPQHRSQSTFRQSSSHQGSSHQHWQPSETAARLGVMVGTACLELSVLPLREQICEFGYRAMAAGASELKLLPIFLMAGVHVMKDIPAEIAAARENLGEDIRLTVCQHLGSHPDISNVLKKRLALVPAESSLLVAHGSRRSKGNKGIEKLAKQLNTQVAYWSVAPDIETQVIELMQQGCQKLTILPYFLFAGGITDAITHRTEELAERFPKVQFRLLPTLGATAEVAKLSVDIVQAA